MSVSQGDPRSFRASWWAHALATLAFLGLAIATASTRSVSPVVLGRYSKAAFGYQLFNVATLAMMVLPAYWGRFRVIPGLRRGRRSPHPNPPPQGGREPEQENPPPQGGREPEQENPSPQGGREREQKSPPPLWGRVGWGVASQYQKLSNDPGGRWRTIGDVLAILSTILAPINESVRNLPGVMAALPMVRLLVAISWIAIEFDRFRRDRKSVRGFALLMSIALVGLSASDLAFWGWVQATSGFEEEFEGYRDRYALETATADDIALVGDSFVWGHGVAKAERFGDVLERLYADEGRRVRVFSLGVRGAGPSRYLESLARVPEGRKIGVAIFSFYPNDLAPRPGPSRRLLHLLQRLTWDLGQSSLTFRVIHDSLGKFESPSVDHYHRSLVDDYRKDDPTFPARWAELIASLDRFNKLAARRSTARPLLLLIPLMVDYRDYPLAQAHRDLRAEAERLGYDVLDLLPTFRAELEDGSRFRSSPNDNHFDARTHELVGSLIKRHLDARPETPGQRARLR